jgi:hypothetical protein
MSLKLLSNVIQLRHLLKAKAESRLSYAQLVYRHNTLLYREATAVVYKVKLSLSTHEGIYKVET